MKAFTVSFFGHRRIDNFSVVEQRVDEIVRSLLREKSYVEFLVGRDGEFDQLVSSAIRRCKREVRDNNSAHVWVMPYVTAEYMANEDSFNDYYDEIIVCEDAAKVHFKTAYRVRNRSMIDKSDMIVFCVQHETGGAWQSMQYAEKQGKYYINLWHTENNSEKENCPI